MVRASILLFIPMRPAGTFALIQTRNRGKAEEA